MSHRAPTWLAGLLIGALAALVVVFGAGFLEGEPTGNGDPSSSGSPPSSPSTSSVPDTDGIPDCAADDLPATTLQVIDDIEAGGPFDYPRNDGGRFGNYEGILPDAELGYYREYTVQTPGLDHRGARRIVTGGDDPVDPEVWFFTDDHYESFCELAADR